MSKKLSDCELVEAYITAASIFIVLKDPEDTVQLTSYDMDDFDHGYEPKDPRKMRALQAVKAKIFNHIEIENCQICKERQRQRLDDMLNLLKK